MLRLDNLDKWGYKAFCLGKDRHYHQVHCLRVQVRKVRSKFHHKMSDSHQCA